LGRDGAGVYVIAGSVASFRRRAMVGVLAVAGSVASFVTAGRLHALGYLPADSRLHVTRTISSSARTGVAVVHRSRDLDPVDTVVVHGIPCTTVAPIAISSRGHSWRIASPAMRAGAAPASSCFATRSSHEAFSDVRVIVELDGRLGHTQLTHTEHDKVRAQEAGAAGWHTMQVTWAQLHLGADALETRLRATLDQRAADLR
jgi:hypothetical protein